MEKSDWTTRAVKMIWLNDGPQYRHWIDMTRKFHAHSHKAEQVVNGIWTEREATIYTLAELMQKAAEYNNPLQARSDIFNALLTGALSEVDWTEIARVFVEQAGIEEAEGGEG